MSIDQITYSLDKGRLDLDLIIQYLQEDSYWAKGRNKSAILKSIDHSLCFAAFYQGQQIGFARAVTDRAVFFYLADIFIIPEYQQKGIGQDFMRYILSHEDLQDMRGILTTQTAHTFYEKFGFTQDSDILSKRMMVRTGNG